MSAGSAWYSNLDEPSFIFSISPALLRVSLSVEYLATASSIVILLVLSSVTMLSSFSLVFCLASIEILGFSSMCRQFILSPRRSMNCMRWNPYSDSTILDSLFGSLIANSSLANSGTSCPLPMNPSSPPFRAEPMSSLYSVASIENDASSFSTLFLYSRSLLFRSSTSLMLMRGSMASSSISTLVGTIGSSVSAASFSQYLRTSLGVILLLLTMLCCTCCTFICSLACSRSSSFSTFIDLP